ncbi:hypothetical protein [Flavobacterium glaciei]|uniref:GDSL-like lipase/acylhydrolase family protein n=1 Tax=Flavobacterium glaciei TaxID=386300 RepID=A0A562Q5U3_9FLAO|nr:hypothetical protein [Flavobacterium glaciei]RDI58322.1 hypothetical protein DFR66_101250 [Flavobacterium glaciei]TWI52109.1 hypothetical protein IQ02_00248 [Flavobacterium glaciei]
MKRFLIFTTKILLLTLLVLVVLDFVYTKVYLQSSNRGKIGYVYNSKGRVYDVVILGSSRANNHFVAPMFEDKGLKAFNYGMSGGHLFEASLFLKLMIERKYIIKNVILEADLNLSNEKESESVASKFMPYIHDSKVIASHFAQQPDFWTNYYLPFYRYIVFEPQIGFREMYNDALKKPTKLLDHLGYYPLGKKPKANMKNDLTNLKPLHNKYYEEIKHLCKINDINLIAVMTPMCTNTKGLDYFEKVHQMYPEIHNYEKAVEGDEYFSSCGHMNDAGARKFTSIILNDFFK